MAGMKTTHIRANRGQRGEVGTYRTCCGIDIAGDTSDISWDIIHFCISSLEPGDQRRNLRLVDSNSCITYDEEPAGHVKWFNSDSVSYHSGRFRFRYLDGALH
jgi:hypothetical protein